MCGRKSECGLFQGLPRGSWENASRSLSSPTSLATSSHSLYSPRPLPLESGRTARVSAPPFLFLAGWAPPGLSRGQCAGLGYVLSEKGRCPWLLALGKPGQLSRRSGEMTQKGLFSSPPYGWILKVSVSLSAAGWTISANLAFSVSLLSAFPGTPLLPWLGFSLPAPQTAPRARVGAQGPGRAGSRQSEGDRRGRAGWGSAEDVREVITERPPWQRFLMNPESKRGHIPKNTTFRPIK